MTPARRLVGGLLAAALLLGGCGGPAPAPAGSVGVGSPAPDFTAPDLDGVPVALHELRGHPVWINFWATWCPTCKTEMPLMEQRYQQHRDVGLVILGMDVQENVAPIRAWMGDQFHWRFLRDVDGRLTDLYRVEGLPAHVFIDRAGVIRALHNGEFDAAGMGTALATILAP